MNSSETKRAQFGARLLNNQRDVFEHNAWDNVQWDEEQLALAQSKIDENSALKLESDRIRELDSNANNYWNSFYQVHQDKFFKDRHWLFTEFPLLLANCSEGRQKVAFERLRDHQQKAHQGKEETFSNPSEADIVTNNTADDPINDRLVIWEIGCGVGNTVMSILDVNTLVFWAHTRHFIVFP